MVMSVNCQRWEQVLHIIYIYKRGKLSDKIKCELLSESSLEAWHAIPPLRPSPAGNFFGKKQKKKRRATPRYMWESSTQHFPFYHPFKKCFIAVVDVFRLLLFCIYSDKKCCSPWRNHSSSPSVKWTKFHSFLLQGSGRFVRGRLWPSARKPLAADADHELWMQIMNLTPAEVTQSTCWQFPPLTWGRFPCLDQITVHGTAWHLPVTCIIVCECAY